ncbi:MAG: hypothetical protein KAH23_04080 [Kiritimatiellae bacterium]|nr:hypothetical protein [Kiritimatiellia bacterium]
MMKKICLLGLLLCTGFCVTSVAIAFDGESMAKLTTVGMYDDVDPFDLALDPALIYKNERWRLYTNASGYEDNQSYLIGTSGKVGPGSLSLFFETQNGTTLRDQDYTYLYERDDRGPLVPPSDNPYDGVPDYISKTMNQDRYQQERDEYDLYTSYGMDIIPNVLSLGLGVAASSSESDWDENDPDSNGWIRYSDPADHTTNYRTYDRYETTVRSGSDSDEGMDIVVGTHWRLTSDLKLRASLAYVTEESDDKDKYSRTYETINYTQSTGYKSINLDTNGNSNSNDVDLDGFEIGLIPTWQINPTIMVRCDLRYRDLTGDSKSSDSSYSTEVDTRQTSVATPVITTRDYRYDSANKQTGDIEETSFLIAPKVYFTYGIAQFSLGVSYQKFEQERNEKYVSGGSKNIHRYYDYTTNDLTHWTESVSIYGDYTDSWDSESEFWSFPIGVLVSLSDKWTFRAGAEYAHVDYMSKSNGTSYSSPQSITTTYDAAGTVTNVSSGSGYHNAAGDWVPYDTTNTKSTDSYKNEGTSHYTTYRLGLGYQMSENVNLDLSFEGNSGAVDTDQLFASITFAF